MGASIVRSLLTGLLFLLVACTTARPLESAVPAVEEPSGGVEITRTCFSDKTQTLLLKPYLEQEREDGHECWDPFELPSMKEAALLPLAPDSEVYRFTSMPSFRMTRVVRVERQGSIVSLHVKEEGRENGTLAIDRRIRLTPTHWRFVQQRLEQARFWTLDSLAPPPCAECTDGTQWLFEGVRKGHYRAVEIHNPEQDGVAAPFYELAVFLTELAGISSADGPLF